MKKLIKRWDFLECERTRVVLGNGVRLDPNNFLELEEDELGFRTDANLSAKTWLSTPRSAKRYIGFQSFHVTPMDEDLNQVTSIGFRLSRNGVEQLFWSGAAWVAASAGQWNTEAQVSANISSLALSVTHRGLQVIMNLVTTDSEYSPQVYHVKALYESDIEWMEDIVVRTFKAALEANIRPISEAVATSDGDTTVTLALEAPYTVTSIDTVYNLTDDPELLTNIFSSYNAGTKVVTMTAAPAVGKRILIRFKYKPEVQLMPSQDAVEIAKVPAIAIGDIRAVKATPIEPCESVIDKVSGQGWRLTGGEQMDLEIPLQVMTSKEKDAHRLSDEIRSYFKRTRLLTTHGTDEKVRVHIWDEHTATNAPNAAGVHGAKLRAIIMGAVFYSGDAEQVTGVLNFEISGSISVEV